jgi:hypothetical protein
VEEQDGGDRERPYAIERGPVSGIRTVSGWVGVHQVPLYLGVLAVNPLDRPARGSDRSSKANRHPAQYALLSTRLVLAAGVTCATPG